MHDDKLSHYITGRFDERSRPEQRFGRFHDQTFRGEVEKGV